MGEECSMKNVVSEIYLVNVTGRDRPGLVASVTRVLAESLVNVYNGPQKLDHMLRY